VQLELRRDTAALQGNLRLLNIVLVPALLTILAIAWGVSRNRRRSRAKV
jgi:ABC-type uncharacterized transport system involved in gliding motility auxiliary subunit